MQNNLIQKISGSASKCADECVRREGRKNILHPKIYHIVQQSMASTIGLRAHHNSQKNSWQLQRSKTVGGTITPDITDTKKEEHQL